MITSLDKQIIIELSNGKQRTEAAETLGISQNEMTYRMQLLFDELNCKTSAHLVATALRNGLIK